MKTNKLMTKDMRKFLALFLLVLGFSIILPDEAKAQVYTYRTTAFAVQKKKDNGNWGEWSDWEDSNMKMVINFDTDVVTINSPTTQRYTITKFIKDYTDNSGGKQQEYAFVDQDGDKGHMRLRKEKNGNLQVYINFDNIRWCYNVKKTN